MAKLIIFTYLLFRYLNRFKIVSWILTLYGPNSFFRRFSGHNLRSQLEIFRRFMIGH